MQKYKRSGWYGNSQGHALAARGVKLYARKQTLVDPLFYAQKREETVGFSHIQDMARNKKTFEEMKMMHPNLYFVTRFDYLWYKYHHQFYYQNLSMN